MLSKRPRATLTFDELLASKELSSGRWITAAAPPTDETRIFGGLLVAHAVVAASNENKRCHAFHGFFVGSDSGSDPFEIAVERTRDGRSFATRRVEIHQNGRLLLAAYTSHHDGDAGPEHGAAMPRVPPPDACEDQLTARTRRSAERGRPLRRYLADELLEFRPVLQPCPDDAEHVRVMWFRSRAPIAGGPERHRAAIAFASDVGLVITGLETFGASNGAKLQAASLDHSLWFHRDAAADDWMLLVQRAPAAAGGRGFVRAAIFARDGRLVASVAQEILARYISIERSKS